MVRCSIFFGGTMITLGVALLLLIGKECEALKLLNVHVPPEVVQGHAANLRCRFNMQGEQLYSVKWYKGAKEFFRFVLKDSPPSQVFPVAGIQVNLSSSDQQQVNIENVTLESGGRYRCEVSAEAPHFQTVSDKAEMSIVVLPRDPPKISVTKTAYHIGDEFVANCTSHRSKPAAQLYWTIADKQVLNEDVIRYPIVQHLDGLDTTVLGLGFRLRSHHFYKGKMQLTCTASVSRMRIDSSSSQNITNSDAVDHPKQRSLESRPVTPPATAGNSSTVSNRVSPQRLMMVVICSLLMCYSLD